MLTMTPLRIRVLQRTTEPDRDLLCAKAIIAAMQETGRERIRVQRISHAPLSTRSCCIILGALVAIAVIIVGLAHVIWSVQ